MITTEENNDIVQAIDICNMDATALSNISYFINVLETKKLLLEVAPATNYNAIKHLINMKTKIENICDNLDDLSAELIKLQTDRLKYKCYKKVLLERNIKAHHEYVIASREFTHEEKLQSLLWLNKFNKIE